MLIIHKNGPSMFVTEELLYISNGCFDAYEVKINRDFLVSGKGKSNLSIPEIF